MKNPKPTLLALLSYCRANDWAGYDPYDALNSRIFELLPFFNSRIARLALTQILKKSPLNLRALLLVPKTQNAKAMALFLMAFMRLSKLGLLNEMDLIARMADRLIALRSDGVPYWCWGYSFPWQTRLVLVPRGAPNLVCTSFVGNALLDAYESCQESRYLSMAASAADYILNDLYWTGQNVTAAFSYPTPSSRTPVHNANFLGAALLCRVFRNTGDQRFVEAALKVARYSASMQQDDGSWHYGEGSTQRWVDNFHTGYNLCALRAIDQSVNTSEFESHIRAGAEFYRKRFFLDDGTPKYFHDRTYPIDIHSVAQSIITLMAFKDIDETNMIWAFRVFEWSMAHMWDERGWFYYQVYPFWKNRISYMRWSQAWMVLALTTLLSGIEGGDGEKVDSNCRM